MIKLDEFGLLAYPPAEERLTVAKFKTDFRVKIVDYKVDDDQIEFDLINVDCSFVNALRRMLRAEVPTMAIDSIYLFQNTSVIADEVLCHRIGLIPLKIDPDLFKFPERPLPASPEPENLDPSKHTLFSFNAKFVDSESKKEAKQQEKPNDSSIKSKPIYASTLEWIPFAKQTAMFESKSPPAPVNPEIIINKLAPNTEIQAKCLAVKGIGRDHAKFEPVSICFYRFHPRVVLHQRVEGTLAEKLKASFAAGVIEIDPLTGVAKVVNERLDNGSREYMRHPDLSSDLLTVSLDPKHFIFKMEAVQSPEFRSMDKMVVTALDIMLEKCSFYSSVIESDNFFQSNGQNLSSKTGFVCGRNVSLEILSISADKHNATFRFNGEDHTIGAALRFCLLQNPKTVFCGYCVPHPLDDAINLELHCKNETAIGILSDGLSQLKQYFIHMKFAFTDAVASFSI